VNWADAVKSGAVSRALKEQAGRCACVDCPNGPDPRWGAFCPNCHEVFVTCDGHEHDLNIDHECAKATAPTPAGSAQARAKGEGE
jgi:hypothetical protein